MIPPRQNAAFVCQMEEVLDVYEEPYDAQRPVVCFDERPLQLLGEPRPALPMQPGQPARYDYEYTREGTGCVLLAVEPLRGWRRAWVLPRRRKIEFAGCIQELLDVHYPHAAQVRLVCDNLNTHNGSAFYAAFCAEEARRLCRRITFVYTPKHGSWLNMAEIEISALDRQCLGRRLPSLEQAQREVTAWEQARNAQEVRVHWQFTTSDARVKLHRLYPVIVPVSEY